MKAVFIIIPGLRGKQARQRIQKNWIKWQTKTWLSSSWHGTEWDGGDGFSERYD